MTWIDHYCELHRAAEGEGIEATWARERRIDEAVRTVLFPTTDRQKMMRWYVPGERGLEMVRTEYRRIVERETREWQTKQNALISPLFPGSVIERNAGGN